MSTKEEALAAKDGAAGWLTPHPDIIGVGVGRSGNEYVIKADCKVRDYTWPKEWDGVPIEYLEGQEVPVAQ